MERLTTEELDAIRARAEKATAGPWRGAYGFDGEATVYSGITEVAEHLYDNDAEFISKAREDVPKLLAEVERLRDEISFIANVDMVSGAYNVEHVAVSVKSWALDALEGVKRR